MNFAIIAAGEGSRLQSEGSQTAKPLVRVGGQTLVGRLIDTFMANGAENIDVITNSSRPEVAEYLRSLDAPLTVISAQTPSSMHSMAAMNLGRHRSKVVATTVDTVFPAADFARYVEAFRRCSDADAFMAITPLIDDEKPLYVDFDPSTGRIRAFLDTPTPTTRYCSGGIYGLTPAALEVLDRCIAEGQSRMRGFQRALIESGLRVKGFVIDRIIDVDHVGDIAKAESIASPSDNTIENISLTNHDQDNG